jgi:hypothetical protein
MDVSNMNLKHMSAGIAAAFASAIFLAQSAQAAQLIATVDVVNQGQRALDLTSSSWSLAGESAASYRVTPGTFAVVNIPLNNPTVDQASFRYSSAHKVCLFRLGHDMRPSQSGGNVTILPRYWADAQSQGSELATCRAKVLNNTPGRGYAVQVEMN